MSKKATGPIFILPDEPVARFSPEMESCFEMLHRAVSRGLEIPDTVDSIVGLVKQLKSLYYTMRDHFEADDGISQTVADALPEMEIGPVTSMLSSWEQDHVIGNREYEQRNYQTTQVPLYTDPADRFHGYVDCWRLYRVWLFEANRALTICRTRISDDAPELPLRRYDWVIRP